MIVPKTGGHTCGSIQLMAVKDYIGTDVPRARAVEVKVICIYCTERMTQNKRSVIGVALSSILNSCLGGVCRLGLTRRGTGSAWNRFLVNIY